MLSRGFTGHPDRDEVTTAPKASGPIVKSSALFTPKIRTGRLVEVRAYKGAWLPITGVYGSQFTVRCFGDKLFSESDVLAWGR